jgi:hypothetical protein
MMPVRRPGETGVINAAATPSACVPNVHYVAPTVGVILYRKNLNCTHLYVIALTIRRGVISATIGHIGYIENIYYVRREL